jgi:hypothetical protein
MPYVGNRPLPGLHPVNNVAGTAPRVREYAVSATYATAIGEGNILVKSTIGVILAPTTAITTIGSVVGVAASNNPAYAAGSNSHQSTILVYDDPMQEYEGILDGTMTSTVQIEAIGQFTLPLTNVYNTTLGQGNTKIDATVTSTFNATRVMLQVVDMADSVGDTIATTQAGNYGAVRVRLASKHNVFLSDYGNRP